MLLPMWHTYVIQFGLCCQPYWCHAWTKSLIRMNTHIPYTKPSTSRRHIQDAMLHFCSVNGVIHHWSLLSSLCQSRTLYQLSRGDTKHVDKTESVSAWGKSGEEEEGCMEESVIRNMDKKRNLKVSVEEGTACVGRKPEVHRCPGSNVFTGGKRLVA